MFAGYLVGGDILQIHQAYTFKMSPPIFHIVLNSDYIQSELNKYLSAFGTVIAVNRGWFASDFDVIIIPTSEYTAEQWTLAMNNSFDTLGYGYSGSTIKLIESGGQVDPSLIDYYSRKLGVAIGNITAPAVSSLTPLLLGLGGIALLIMLPKSQTPQFVQKVKRKIGFK